MHAGEENHERPGWIGIPVKESIRMAENRDKWRKYAHSLANPTFGSKTAKEQNRSYSDR